MEQFHAAAVFPSFGRDRRFWQIQFPVLTQKENSAHWETAYWQESSVSLALQTAGCSITSCQLLQHARYSRNCFRFFSSNKSLASQFVISSVSGSDFEPHRNTNTTQTESFFQWLIYPTCAPRAADFPR